MDKPGFYAQISKLYNIINAALTLDSAIGESEDEKLKDILFVRFSAKLCDFCRNAAILERRGAFATRMSEFFAEITSQKSFSDFAAKAAELEENCSIISCFTVTVQDSLYGSEKKEGKSVCTRLQTAAEALGIELETAGSIEYRASDEFTRALLEDHTELCDLASQFRKKYKDSADRALLTYADELSFCLALHSLAERIKDAGIPLCKPQISEKSEIRLYNGYDITLLEKGETNIIPNDAEFCGEEKFFFLGGANGGGKTTFLRTVGVNLLLAVSGAPVAADSAVLGLCDGIFTHFPRDEHFEGEGRFDNEKRRVNEIISELGDHPLVLLNETYSTTNEEKSIVNTSVLADTLRKLDVYGIYVTHAHEAKAEGVPRLIAAVDESDGNRRTYKVVRAAEAKSSFAIDILKKYSLTAKQLDARFPKKEEKE